MLHLLLNNEATLVYLHWYWNLKFNNKSWSRAQNKTASLTCRVTKTPRKFKTAHFISHYFYTNMCRSACSTVACNWAEWGKHCSHAALKVKIHLCVLYLPHHLSINRGNKAFSYRFTWAPDTVRTAAWVFLTWICYKQFSAPTEYWDPEKCVLYNKEKELHSWHMLITASKMFNNETQWLKNCMIWLENIYLNRSSVKEINSDSSVIFAKICDIFVSDSTINTIEIVYADKYMKLFLFWTRSSIKRIPLI